jgi:polysaccharide pyruvyl transferase WcaK-like protein
LAKRLGIPVQLQCTITPVNVYNIVHVREYAIANDFEVIFRIASYIARLSNGDLTERIKLGDKQRSFVADFLEAPRTILATKSLGRRLFYSDLANRLKTDAPRLAPCSFQSNALFLSPDQSIYNCSRSEVKLDIEDRNDVARSINSEKNKQILSDLISNTCTSCYHDQSGRWPLWKYFTVHNKFYSKFNFLKKIIKIPGILKNTVLPIKNIKHEVSELNNVLIIGSYGGEHVGDAAILGGVILRLKEKYGIKNFTIISIRPDRTKCWVQNLLIEDVSINVIGVNNKLDIKNFKALVLAGGPIMSIPILLSNHLNLVRKFKAQNKPFIVEGVGIGPLKDKITRLMANKILKSANAISVRTNKDIKIALKLGLDVNQTTDPAFDYLNQLTLSNFKPHSTLDSIINTEKDIWVINLRPLWSKYANENNLNNLENNIIESISSVLYKYKENHRFIFMPMNSDQFGFSDLEVAYKLEKNVNKMSDEIDFKIWEYEPDINNCIYLLKKAKLAISMRFHGCIFSLSNNVPTLGLDYSTSEKGKVYSLFEDFKIEKNVINIKDLNPEVLVEKINSILPSL